MAERQTGMASVSSFTINSLPFPCVQTLLKLLTFFAGEQELTPTNITNLLRQVNFRFDKHWSEVGRRLNIGQGKKQEYRHKAVTQGNSDSADAFEECTDDWLRNSREPSWDKILQVIAAVDKSAARYIRRSLGLPSGM